MRKLYQINTNNRHGQVLIFTSKKQAKTWLEKATTNPNQHIIEELTPEWQGFYSVFPLNNGLKGE